MKFFEVEKIQPRKPRHTVTFTRDELTAILKEHMARQGVQVPKGNATVWGLERRPDPEAGSRYEVTLCIDPN